MFFVVMFLRFTTTVFVFSSSLLSSKSTRTQRGVHKVWITINFCIFHIYKISGATLISLRNHKLNNYNNQQVSDFPSTSPGSTTRTIAVLEWGCDRISGSRYPRLKSYWRIFAKPSSLYHLLLKSFLSTHFPLRSVWGLTLVNYSLTIA